MQNNSMLNVRDVTDYLYCKRKVYLRKIKGAKEKLNAKMISGSVKHGVFDELNKKEQEIVIGLTKKLSIGELGDIYKKNILDITQEVFQASNCSKFGINFEEFWQDSWKSFNREIQPRIRAISKLLEKNVFSNELWQELEPKYLTELKIISEKLQLVGRIDRIAILKKDSRLIYVPFELKSGSVKEPYESDLIQLASYALLIEEEFNTTVDKGFVEYSNKKIPVEISILLKNRVLDIINDIKNFNLNEIPSINSNFNKCKNCGLKEECFKIS